MRNARRAEASPDPVSEDATETSTGGSSGPEEVSAPQRGKRARESDHSNDLDEELSYHLESDSGSEGAEEEDVLPLGERVTHLADGSTSRPAMRTQARAAARAAHIPRENRHRPAEASSKRPVPVLRESMQSVRSTGRDPRFESLAGGTFSEPRFKAQYAFLYDEKLPEERMALRAALKRTKAPEAVADLQARLTRVEQALREETSRRWKAEFNAKLQSKEKTAVKGGKTPFHLKKSERKRLELVAKYEELKASGRLDKYMEKRRKKNAAKDHRYLTAPRSAQGEGGGA